MSFRLTGILLGVLIVLAGAVWFSEFKDKDATPETKPDTQQREIFKFDAQNVRTLEIVKGDQKMTAERNDQGEWTLQPSGQPGDRVRITSVMFRLSGLSAQRRVADEATNLADFGLDQPSLTTSVMLKDGTVYQLLVGAKAPGETSGTYVKAADSPVVFTVANQLVQDLERLVTDPPIQLPTPTPAEIPTPPEPPSPSPSPSGCADGPAHAAGTNVSRPTQNRATRVSKRLPRAIPGDQVPVGGRGRRPRRQSRIRSLTRVGLSRLLC
jgi:hypothetical protein